MKVLRSLTGKFLLIGAVFFLLVAAVIIAGLLFSSRHQGDASRINLAGQMRYRTFEITWLAHQLFEKETVPIRSEFRSDLLGKIAALDGVMGAIRDGQRSGLLAPLPAGEDRESLHRIISEWQTRFRPLFSRLADLPAGAEEARYAPLLAVVDAGVQPFVDRINLFVTALQEGHERDLARFWRHELLAAVFFLVVGAGVVFALRQSVVVPLRRLHAAASALQAGDYDHRVAPRGQDEIGDLGRAYNQMAETLSVLLQEMRERVQELEVIGKIAQAANRSRILPPLLDEALDVILELDFLHGGKKGAVFLVTDEGNALSLAASRNFSDEEKRSCGHILMGSCLCGRIREGGKALLGSETIAEIVAGCRCPGMQTYGRIVLPLRTPQGPLGGICLYLPDQEELSRRRLELLQSLADIVTVSVQNALGHRQMAMLAQALESNQDLVLITDLEGSILHANPAAASYTGYRGDELIGRDVFLLVAPEKPEVRVGDLLRRTLGQPWVGEVRCARREGTMFAAQLTSSVVRDEGGARIAMVWVFKDITAQKAAVERVRESEARFRRLAENAEDIIYIIRLVPDLGCAYINPAVMRITGYSPGEYYADPELVSKILLPEDREVLRQMQVADFDFTTFLVLRWVRKDGSVVWTEQKNAPIYDEAGTLVAIQGIARDITEKRASEQYLEETHNRLVEAQRIAQMGNWEWDLHNERVLCSEEVERILGFEPGRCYLGFDDFLSVVHPEDRERLDACLREARREGRSFRCEHRILRIDGAVLTVLQHGEVDLDVRGRAQRIVGTIQDVSERKRAEAELRRSEASLRNAQRIAALGSWDWDLVADEVRWSDEAYAIFGLRPQGPKPSYETFISVVHPEDRERVAQAVEGAVHEARPYSIDHRILLPDGRERIVHEHAEVLFDAPGKARGMSGTVQDITERKHLEEQLREYSERLEEKIRERTSELELAKAAAEAANRAKSEFLANMSHELRTPLNSVLGFSGLVADGLAGPVTAEQAEYLNDVIESARHLLSLINDILDLSKVESGMMELAVSEVGLKELLDGALLMFREKASRHALRMTAEVEAGVETVEADERVVKQIIYNLLSNAVKFTPDGGRIQVRARLVGPVTLSDGSEEVGAPGDRVEISVEDTGIGIAAEDQLLLFLPFYQVDTTLTKRYPGTGLGLSLCKRFVERHGGTIGVTSSPGKGSRFVFVIPVHQFEPGAGNDENVARTKACEAEKGAR